ncbi:hypothetical protein [Fusobacterium animalis]|uniref:hypothetical protein n=1 Tax=Fusobacterium animalis TaxID=76859 RepID=UPI0030CCD4CB
MWLIKAHTSQEAPTSTSGSSSLNEYNKNYTYLLNNVNEKNQILKKYKGKNRNIKKI